VKKGVLLFNLWGKIPQSHSFRRDTKMEGKSIKDQINEARVELTRLSPLYKEVNNELKKLDTQITYWANKKHQLERKEIEVKKCPPYMYKKRVKKSKKEPTINELIDAVTLSGVDRERLLAALTP